MRYEFERDGAVVASVLWEGPGQVRSRPPSRQLALDGGSLPLLRGDLPGLGLRLRRGGRGRRPADAPARLDPVGVRARLSQPGHRLSATVQRVETGPVEEREVAAR